jgi:uncharacterized membrane protein
MFMPRIYRWLLTASGVTYLLVALIDGHAWGIVEEVIMLLAGIFVLLAAQKPNRTLTHAAAYSAGIAGLFQVVSAVVANATHWHLATAAVWFMFTTYTVLLVAFGWVREPPE